MPANIEWKARARDPGRLRELAEAIAGSPGTSAEQTDYFFVARRGRLKLRVLAQGFGELIFYERGDAAAAKESRFRIVRTSQTRELRDMLTLALGLRGVVRKRRRLFLSGPMRIHLDEVEGLGAFVEVEVAVTPGHPAETAGRLAEELRERLEVRADELVGAAYIDLLDGLQ